ncbi:hypothetical protein N7466_002845 [Penicillium verhagenii]|uniref:uncharacterized protein n=1 Tax=Penicillium verhagenii TaxID=1562060 RepID=UPI0025450C8E|nr:uncharacterized protein N7466_002845 [Penicillium verhagenii]KAJ5939711.1 hypothetical protein N7466_002845 [Penicillium verhagenii]
MKLHAPIVAIFYILIQSTMVASLATVDYCITPVNLSSAFNDKITSATISGGMCVAIGQVGSPPSSVAPPPIGVPEALLNALEVPRRTEN